MDIIESYVELLAGMLILIFSMFMLYDYVIDPSLEDMMSARQASLEKSVTFENSYEDIRVGDYVIDEGVYDKLVGSPGRVFDTGTARMSFRAEQIMMLPIVDTDVSSNPGVANGFRTVGVSTLANPDTGSGNRTETQDKSLTVASPELTVKMTYPVTAESVMSKNLIAAGTTISGADANNLYSSLLPHFNLSVNGKPYYGTQLGSANVTNYGGFNLTVDAQIHPLSGKRSNSLIFISGRVGSK